MVSVSQANAAVSRLGLGIVLSTTEDAATVCAAGQLLAAPYATQFPVPRVERVAPGHLVALAPAPGGTAVIVCRGFDAIGQGADGRTITLWEPGHGTVLAEPRDPQRLYRPGSRAYLSAGLPGAEWWVAGPAVERAEDADVDTDQVEQLVTSLGL